MVAKLKRMEAKKFYLLSHGSATLKEKNEAGVDQEEEIEADLMTEIGATKGEIAEASMKNQEDLEAEKGGEQFHSQRGRET